MKLLRRVTTMFKAKINAAVDGVEDPREMLDYAYEEQRELLVKTKQGAIEVAAARAQLDGQARRLTERATKVEDQARRAVEAGREDLARLALQKRQTLAVEMQDLAPQVTQLRGEEQRMTRACHELSARVDEFKVRRGVVAARYDAAKAQVGVGEALSGVSGEFAELGMALGRAMEKTERMQARAEAIDSLIDLGTLDVLGQTEDRIEGELRALSAGEAVESQLEAIKIEVEEAAKSPSWWNFWSGNKKQKDGDEAN
jgi:phage shock protein A